MHRTLTALPRTRSSPARVVTARIRNPTPAPMAFAVSCCAADPRLHEPAVHPGHEEPGRDQDAGCFPRGSASAPRQRVPQRPQRHADHQERQELLEGSLLDSERRQRAQHRPDRRRDRRSQRPSGVEHAVFSKTPDGADVLEQDAHPVGAVGGGGGKPQEDQDRKRQERAAPGQDVERACDDAGREQRQISGPVARQVAASRRTTIAADRSRGRRVAPVAAPAWQNAGGNVQAARRGSGGPR